MRRPILPQLYERGAVPGDVRRLQGRGQGGAAEVVNHARYSPRAVQLVATESRLVFPFNPRRGALLIQNMTGAAVRLGIGVPPGSEPGSYIEIVAGGNYEPTVVPTDAIWLRGTAGDQSVMAAEGN